MVDEFCDGLEDEVSKESLIYVCEELVKNERYEDALKFAYDNGMEERYQEIKKIVDTRKP